MWKRKDKNKQKLLGSFLNDLTHLEINTIIKDGMISGTPPTNPIELLRILLEQYKTKLNRILSRTEKYDGVKSFDNINSFENFSAALTNVSNNCVSDKIRLNERDYILFLRMKSVCDFMKSQLCKHSDGVCIYQGETQIKDTDLFSLALEENSKYSCTIDTNLLVKLKRYYDLGTEEIILQTRIGIDGDIVTRVQRDFANEPRQLLVDLHEKHTTMSMEYWKTLIQITVNVIGGILKNRKK